MFTGGHVTEGSLHLISFERAVRQRSNGTVLDTTQEKILQALNTNIENRIQLCLDLRFMLIIHKMYEQIKRLKINWRKKNTSLIL